MIASIEKIVLCAALPLAAHATVIDFDVDVLGVAITSGRPITNQYSNLGVGFQGLEDGSSVNILAVPDPDDVPAPSGPNVLRNCASDGLGCPCNRSDIVRITLSSMVSQITLSLNALGSEAVAFNQYDAPDNLLETKSVTSAGSVFVRVSFVRIRRCSPDRWSAAE